MSGVAMRGRALRDRARRARRGFARRLATSIAALAAAAILAAAARASAVELHGALDAFAAPGVALAWAIQRGSDDASTEVVVRIEADPRRYRFVSVVGVDPFTHAAQALLPPTPVPANGGVIVRIARARFADLPRTEWRLHAGTADEAPALVIDYGGVPDTTPEFTDPARLAASLADRIERVRRERGT